MISHEIFTVGHSNRTLEEFIQLLDQHHCSLVADVRSTPYSRRFPQFNRELLSRSLMDHGIVYLFLGKELGARRFESQCYVDGVARYDLIARSPEFICGIDCLLIRSQNQRIVLMCSEREPLDCHRCILISRHIADKFNLNHIIDESCIEPHEQTENRLLRMLKLDGQSFFDSRSQRLLEAYERQGMKIAYRSQVSRHETMTEHLT